MRKVNNSVKVLGYPSLSQSTNIIWAPWVFLPCLQTSIQTASFHSTMKSVKKVYLSLRKKIKENGVP